MSSEHEKTASLVTIPEEGSNSELDNLPVGVNPIPASRVHNRLNLAKRTLQGAAIISEINPITNEGLRFGAFGATLAETHNTLVAAGVLGGTTFAVEGAGALAAASILSSDRANKVLDWTTDKAKKVIKPGSKIPSYGEVGVAMTAGTPVLMSLKKLANPERTYKQTRNHGLFTASWMSSVFAAEGAVLGNSVENYNDPKMWAASAIALGGLAWIVKKSKNALKKSSEVDTASPAVVSAAEAKLSADDLAISERSYLRYHEAKDECVRMGLYGEDLTNALTNPESELLPLVTTEQDTAYAPLLVPVDSLEWYNTKVLSYIYGEDHKFFYYAHPPIPEQEDLEQSAKDAIKKKLDEGAVVITERYISQPDSLKLLELGDGYKLELITGEGLTKKDDVFVGRVDFDGIAEIKEAPSLYDVYKEAVAAGDIKSDGLNGPELVAKFSKEDAEAVWEMYEKPFAKLGADDPAYAGFDKDSLLSLLDDPNVAKIIYKDEGKIASLCFFAQDFNHFPWFNEEFYKENYPEYYNTGNILIFPGIVSDERLKGSTYSGILIDLAMQLYAKRGSNVLVTFECTEISSRYIPRIVKRSISNSGVGDVSGLDKAVSTKEYVALRAAN